MAMTNVKPDVDLQGRYSIKEVCALLGINRETLRRHTNNGNIAVHFRKVNNRPYYQGVDIIGFWNRNY